jgi:hypothetical protein
VCSATKLGFVVEVVLSAANEKFDVEIELIAVN